MKLATFSTADDHTPRLGVVIDSGIVDLRASDLPATMMDFLSAGEDAVAAARAAAEAAAAVGTAATVDLGQATLHAPITNPGNHLHRPLPRHVLAAFADNDAKLRFIVQGLRHRR